MLHKKSQISTKYQRYKNCLSVDIGRLSVDIWCLSIDVTLYKSPLLPVLLHISTRNLGNIICFLIFSKFQRVTVAREEGVGS